MPEKLFRILVLLLQANGRLVDKDMLLSRVWSEENANEANLVQHMALLRKFLRQGDSSRPYILSVYGKGYQFAEPVSVVLPSQMDILSESAASFGRVLLSNRFESFNLYCKASHFLEKRTAVEIQKAIALFRGSLDQDPNYAPAWFGLSRAHALLGGYAYVKPSQAFPLARAAAEKGLGLDANSATGHALLSEILVFGEWDFLAAKASLETALALNPQSLFVRHNIAWFYLCSGAFDRAILEAEHGLLLDPASTAFLLILARALMFHGDVAQAISCCSNVIESEPDHFWARVIRAIGFILVRTPRLAIDDLLCLPRVGPEMPLLIRAYVDAGEPKLATHVLNDMEVLSKSQYVSHWDLAIIAAAVDRSDEALEELRRAMEAREPLMLLLRGLSNLFDSINTEFQFQRLLNQLPHWRSREEGAFSLP